MAEIGGSKTPAPSPRLLIDCEEDRTLRAVPFVLLAEMERNQPDRVTTDTAHGNASD
jgi:hypothetical protein